VAHKEAKTPRPQPSAENDSDTNGPTAKAPKMSLQLHKQKKKVLSPSSSFNNTVSTEEIDKSSKECIPKNMLALHHGQFVYSSSGSSSITNAWMSLILLIS